VVESTDSDTRLRPLDFFFALGVTGSGRTNLLSLSSLPPFDFDALPWDDLSTKSSSYMATRVQSVPKKIFGSHQRPAPFRVTKRDWRSRTVPFEIYSFQTPWLPTVTGSKQWKLHVSKIKNAVITRASEKEKKDSRFLGFIPKNPRNLGHFGIHPRILGIFWDKSQFSGLYFFLTQKKWDFLG